MKKVMCNINEKVRTVPYCSDDCYDCKFEKECYFNTSILPNIIEMLHSVDICNNCKIKDNCKYSKYKMSRSDKKKHAIIVAAPIVFTICILFYSFMYILTGIFSLISFISVSILIFFLVFAGIDLYFTHWYHRK